jgi:hypothetical protein
VCEGADMIQKKLLDLLPEVFGLHNLP